MIREYICLKVERSLHFITILVVLAYVHSPFYIKLHTIYVHLLTIESSYCIMFTLIAHRTSFTKYIYILLRRNIILYNELFYYFAKYRDMFMNKHNAFCNNFM